MSEEWGLTACIVRPQTVDKGYATLRERNQGTMSDGRSFGEAMPFFLLGGDETCFLASDGDVSIIGDKEKKKHQLHAADSRTSITVYRSGSAAGANGPTGFLPPGQRCKSGYTPEFLLKHGAAPGSVIVMTPTGFMTEDAWEEMAPAMCKGIRNMPVIRDMPDWWVLKIVDGFGPHTSSLKAMEIYNSHKILLLKEEGDASHVNQAYDQHVAKADKRSMRGSLTFLRSSTRLTKNVVDGWQLVHVALAAVRELDAQLWIDSFRKVNLHPHHRVDFAEWCKTIDHYLQGGQSFKVEAQLDEYALLPSFWHGMEPEEKKLAMSILERHQSTFSVACVRALHSELHVPLADMQNLRVCLELAENDRSHLDRRLPEKRAAADEPEAITAARTTVTDLDAGLRSFCLHPKRANGEQLLSGAAKFEHLTKLARRSVSEREVD